MPLPLVARDLEGQSIHRDKGNVSKTVFALQQTHLRKRPPGLPQFHPTAQEDHAHTAAATTHNIAGS